MINAVKVKKLLLKSKTNDYILLINKLLNKKDKMDNMDKRKRTYKKR